MHAGAALPPAGFSLIEIIVSGALFMILCVAIVAVYRVGLNTESVTAQRVVLQDGLATGMKALDRDIAEASSSLLTSSSASVTVQVPTFDPSGSPTGRYDLVTFSASGDSLYQTVVAAIGSSRKSYLNKRVLTNLPVPYPSPGLFSYWTRTSGTLNATPPDQASIVRVWLRQTAKYGRRSQSVDLTQDIRMRNH